MAELARQFPDAIRLDAGDPSFNTPSHICDAARDAMSAGFTTYTPSGGYATLRGSIVEKLSHVNEIEARECNVVVTAGGCGGLFTSLMTLLDPGDEALIPSPGWPNYRAMVHVLGGVIVDYPVDLARGTIDVDEIAARVTARTKIVIVNSPNNPAGAVYDANSLRALGSLCDAKDLWLISDECYDQLVYQGAHVSAALHAPPERTICIFSFSKTYAMTGWRVGYVLAPEALAEELAKAQEPVHGNASSVSQKAAEAALTGSQDCVTRMREAYRARRGLAIDLLSRGKVRYVEPDGAFYILVDVSPLGSSMDAARILLERDQVSVVPGSAFGSAGEGWARVSLCGTVDALASGLRRLIERLSVADHAVPDSA